MPTSNARYQAVRRARLRQAGKRQITAVVDDSAADLLRQLSQEHGKTQGEVLALGLLLARQRLAQPAVPAEQESVPQPQPEAHEQPVAMRKPEARALALTASRCAPEPAADALPTNPEQELPAWRPANATELLGRN